ncbi:hypothetical protein V1477_016233 [Vespula maculifrons]|uniref:Uncharacterized protein n=1 Tax=Vespula maculifrons TaxID=7453 RepID=A0ABD2BCF6_VESMC
MRGINFSHAALHEEEEEEEEEEAVRGRGREIEGGGEGRGRGGRDGGGRGGGAFGTRRRDVHTRTRGNAHTAKCSGKPTTTTMRTIDYRRDRHTVLNPRHSRRPWSRLESRAREPSSDHVD